MPSMKVPSKINVGLKTLVLNSENVRIRYLIMGTKAKQPRSDKFPVQLRAPKEISGKSDL